MSQDSENQQHTKHSQDAVAHLFMAQRFEYNSPVHLRLLYSKLLLTREFLGFGFGFFGDAGSAGNNFQLATGSFNRRFSASASSLDFNGLFAL